MKDTRTYPTCEHRSDGKPCSTCIGNDLRAATTGMVAAIEGFIAAFRESQRRYPAQFSGEGPRVSR